MMDSRRGLLLGRFPALQIQNPRTTLVVGADIAKDRHVASRQDHCRVFPRGFIVIACHPLPLSPKIMRDRGKTVRKTTRLSTGACDAITVTGMCGGESAASGLGSDEKNGRTISSDARGGRYHGRTQQSGHRWNWDRSTLAPACRPRSQRKT